MPAGLTGLCLTPLSECGVSDAQVIIDSAPKSSRSGFGSEVSQWKEASRRLLRVKESGCIDSGGAVGSTGLNKTFTHKS
jgi:hypothetical protein